jgi:hypothetical protein
LDEALTQFVAGARGEGERGVRERAAAHVRQIARGGGGGGGGGGGNEPEKDTPPGQGGDAQTSAARLAALLSGMFGGER